MNAGGDSSYLRLAFYGDDFTGSTDALEVLAFAGVNTALLLEPPTAATLARFPGVQAIGVAGDSRAMSPEEMNQHLPAVFAALATCGAPIVHYKVCSTFDSAPGIGSIGHAMKLAQQCFQAPWVPVVGATPALQRYCLFGHLFARSGTDGQVYRIDRHPIMSVHPVTPMDESDLEIHLGRQTTAKFGRITLQHLDAGLEAARRELDRVLGLAAQAVLFDGATESQLSTVGALLAEHARRTPGLFVVGPSGVEYALTQSWRERGEQLDVPADYDYFKSAQTVLAVSGSASRLSELQVDAAIAAGFAQLPIDTQRLVDEAQWRGYAQTLVDGSLQLLGRGQSIIAHTARGPDDQRVTDTLDSLLARGWSIERARREGGRLIGQRLGQVVRAIIDGLQTDRERLNRARRPRLLIGGGDTSSQITKVLAPLGLVVAARLTRGAPLCRLVSDDVRLDGLEVALKGGQMGEVDFYVKAKAGTA